MDRSNPPWAELVQLVPIVSLAAPFIVQGEVELARAGTAFVVATALAIPINAVLLATGRVLNPILLATAAWLALGAVAFGLGIEGLVAVLERTQAFGIFAAALVVGVAATAASPHGYIGARREPEWVRRWSLVLLGLTAVAVAWAWVWRSDIRIGGGLPFIALNVARRAICARL